MTLRLALALGGAAAVLAAILGLYWKGRLEGAAAERPKVEAALGQAAAASLEAQGARESVARVDVVVRRRAAADETVASLAPAALQSEDAHAPLGPDRAARLLRADHELCRIVPDLDGCAAPD